MKGLVPYCININGTLFDLSEPQVMGILNVTPDSFYSSSRKQTSDEIEARVRQIVNEGASIIDIGACSSRPGADCVSSKEEMDRLRKGLQIIKNVAPDKVVSVDTYRADVAKMCVEEYGVGIVNDISGGMFDKDMFATVAALRVPYILMHIKGNPQNMQDAAYYDDVVNEVFAYFSEKVQKLRDLGMKDIILDPGYGFGKTIEHNYELMNHQEELKVFDLPLLVGISRKSMIYKTLDTTPEEALNGTSVLNTIALMKGANILRVHDVAKCVEAVKLVKKLLEK